MNERNDKAHPVEILLVEDSENDLLLTLAAFEQARLKVKLHHVWNGEECMEFLRKQGPHANAPTPDLILLDLNMPRMNGHEVLAELNADERLRRVPVVVLTTSAADADILKSYELKCSSYLIKPIGFESFTHMIRSFADYWLTLVKLPPKSAPAADGPR